VPIGDVAGQRYEADLLWREHGLIVEFDSFEHHGDRDSFHSDRARDAYLLTLGYRVLRITWEQLVDQPQVVIARIAGALAARPAV
jgi:very-short-patch-repair endonuclease